MSPTVIARFNGDTDVPGLTMRQGGWHPRRRSSCDYCRPERGSVYPLQRPALSLSLLRSRQRDEMLLQHRITPTHTHRVLTRRLYTNFRVSLLARMRPYSRVMAKDHASLRSNYPPSS